MFMKQIRALSIAGLLIVLLSGTASAYAGQGESVRLSDGSEPLRTVVSKSETVEQLLQAEGIEIGEFDIVSPALDTEVTKNMRINIARAFAVYVSVDGQEPVEVMTTSMQIYQFSAAYGRSVSRVFLHNTDIWLDVVEPNMLIELTSKPATLVEERSMIPFAVERVETSELLVGTEEVAVEGRTGVRLKTYEMQHTGFLETARVLVSEMVETAPVAKVIMVGTGEPEPEPELEEEPVFEYTSVLTMNATAYTLSYSCTGKRPGDRYFGICASGMTAQYGVVAVDPKVIPLHTKLYIEGYGFAIAGDTGGAIKGNKIDLFFDPTEDLRAFGRQTLQVYILADQDMDLGIDLYKAVEY